MALSTCGPGHRQGWEAMADGSGAQPFAARAYSENEGVVTVVP